MKKMNKETAIEIVRKEGWRLKELPAEMRADKDVVIARIVGVGKVNFPFSCKRV